MTTFILFFMTFFLEAVLTYATRKCHFNSRFFLAVKQLKSGYDTVAYFTDNPSLSKEKQNL